MTNFRATLQQIANTALVSALVAVAAKRVALVLVLVLITPSPERDECLT
jgi:hypothetical protein